MWKRSANSKRRYFRLMDTRQWDLLSECFAADVSALYEGAPRAGEDLPRDIKIEGPRRTG